MEENNSNIALQNPTEYKLTDKESILLEVLLNPEYRTKSVTEMCKIANCTRSTYYDAFQKPGFVAIYEQKTKDLVKQYIGPVINSVAREAVRGSYNHAKMILEMAGLYSEKQQIDINTDININLNADERKQRIIELLNKKELEGAIPVDFKDISGDSYNTIVKSDSKKETD